MIVPSTDVWARGEFLVARLMQMRAQKAADKAAGLTNVEYIEPDEDVLCDVCNDEILDEQIRLVEFGRRAVCVKCFNIWYAHEPLRHREVRPDGSLGEYVKIGGENGK